MILRGNEQSKTNDLVDVVGSFALGTYPATATYDFAVAAGSGITITADSEGAGGNSLDFTATDDGLAKAALDLATCTTIDTVIQAATGGEAGNDWTISMAAISGSGVLIYEDATAKQVLIAFEDGVSTVANLETAIGGCTYIEVKTTGTGATVLDASDDEFVGESLAGGTAQEWAASDGTTTTLHYTHNTTTEAEAVTAINAVASNKVVTASTEGSTDVIVTGDAVSAQSLTGGITEASLSSSTDKGSGFSVAHSATGTYLLTFDTKWPEIIEAKISSQSATATEFQIYAGTYSASAGTLYLFVWGTNSAALIDPTPGAGERANFCITFRRR